MLLLYPSKLFSKLKNIFQKCFSNGFPKTGFEVFSYVWSFTAFPKACFTAFLHMCEPRVVDLISTTPLSVHISVVLGKSFPFYFKMNDITPHWVEPGLSIEGDSWMRSLVSYWAPICRHFWVHRWTGVAKKAPLDLLYPTTSMKRRIRWSRSPLRIWSTYQLSCVSYSWPRLSQNLWRLGKAKNEWTSKPRVGYPS